MARHLRFVLSIGFAVILTLASSQRSDLMADDSPVGLSAEVPESIFIILHSPGPSWE